MAASQDHSDGAGTNTRYGGPVALGTRRDLQAASRGGRHRPATERSQQHGRLSGAIGQISPRQQQVLRMYYDEGLTLREIAESLSVTESRVSQIHSGIVARLRVLMADC